MSTTEIVTFAPAGTWTVDPVHSTVGFEIGYMAGTFRGTFRDLSARLTVEGDSARLEGTARVASVDVKDENLSAHLQSPEFFDAERHPELRFSADEIRVDGERVAVPGQITIRGVTHPVEVAGTVAAPLVDPYGNDRIGLNLTAALDRTAFGLNWNNPLPSGEPALSNDVTIVADLQFVRGA
jgi:polyisoprenoid-binding protein YceI